MILGSATGALETEGWGILTGLRRHGRRSWTVGGATALAIAVSLAFAGVAAADSTSGQVGYYQLTDTQANPGAVCNYNVTHATLDYLSSVMVPAPSVWWLNQNALNQNESGLVGWQITLQRPVTNGFQDFARTRVQKKTASEHSRLGLPHKAAFTALTLNVTGSPRFPSTMYWRVLIHIYWYAADASQLGSATHIVRWYGDGRLDPPVGHKVCPNSRTGI